MDREREIPEVRGFPGLVMAGVDWEGAGVVAAVPAEAKAPLVRMGRDGFSGKGVAVVEVTGGEVKPPDIALLLVSAEESASEG